MQWAITSKEFINSRFNVVNIKATYLYFYISTILINAIQVHNERYENLVASIGSTMKPLTSSILIIVNSSKGSTFLECFKLPMPLVVGRL